MSTYSTNLALELIGTGEQAGVWGTTTNTNLGTLIEQAISGYVTQAVATGTDTTITIPNGATGVARNMYIELTGTGGTNTNLIVPANKKLYFIFNNSTGAVTVKVSGQTGVSVPQGKKVVLTSNGTDIVNGLNYIADFGSNSATITQLTATSATITNLTLTSLVISNLSIASANITTLTATNETISGNLTLSGGTANGVLYLNGSKVATSGTTLAFDGTNLGVGAASGTSSGYATAPQLLNYSASATNLLNASDTTSTIRSALYRDTTGAGIISMAKFRGTYASPTAVQSGDTSGRLWFEVWGGSNLRRIAEVGALVDTYTSDTNISGTLYFATSTSGNASSNEKMRLTAAGNLGINTTTPGYFLEIVNNNTATSIGLTRTSATARTWTMGVDGDGGYRLTDAVNGVVTLSSLPSSITFLASQSDLVFKYNSTTEGMRLTSTGLGIGTASPGTKLQVSGGFLATTGIGVQLVGNSSGANSKIQYTDGVTYNWTAGTTGNAFTISSGEFGSTTGTERLRIDSSGNLGLGVTPSAWGTQPAIQQLGGALWGVNAANYEILQNAFYNGTNYIYRNTNLASRYNQNAGVHSWFTAPSGTAGNAISFTQAMTLDASGQLSVGTTAVTTAGSGYQAFTINGANGSNLALNGGGTNIGLIYAATGNSNLYIGNQTAGGAVIFNAGSGTERARITSGGEFLLGTTTAGDGFFRLSASANAYNIIKIDDTGSTGGNYIQFLNSAGNQAGSINHNGTTTVNYGSGSDYRLKENIAPMTGALAKVALLKPCTFTWKTDGTNGQGFIAHELQEVVPDAVVGKKDEVNEDGSIKTQTVDTSFLVATLTAAIQEQQVMINELKAKVAALEAK